ncbi:MAG: hypothetical protein OEU51_10870, partial [Gammaproteobacteria bacterium]|nr:hypothetical protein [Gammaproteobacteria bacterium]
MQGGNWLEYQPEQVLIKCTRNFRGKFPVSGRLCCGTASTSSWRILTLLLPALRASLQTSSASEYSRRPSGKEPRDRAIPVLHPAIIAKSPISKIRELMAWLS